MKHVLILILMLSYFLPKAQILDIKTMPKDASTIIVHFESNGSAYDSIKRYLILGGYTLTFADSINGIIKTSNEIKGTNWIVVNIIDSNAYLTLYFTQLDATWKACNCGGWASYFVGAFKELVEFSNGIQSRKSYR
jgi:hypothetical protein